MLITMDRFSSMPHVRFQRWLRLLAMALLVAQAPTTQASKVIGPPSIENVASIWIGLSENELYLFRIILSLKGESTVGYVFVDQEPNMIVIRSWRYDEGEIEIDVQFPQGSEDWEGPMVGSVNLREMSLRISGKGWSRSIFLRRESDLERRWLALKDRMATPTEAEAGLRRR